MVELIRRIIPQKICGGNEIKLRKMDSLVHAFYEIAGTGGAFFSVFTLLKMGSVYANCYVPPLWILAGWAWVSINLSKPEEKQSTQISEKSSEEKCGLLMFILKLFKNFLISSYHGALIIFSDRKFVWLIFGYSIPLVMHRYLESQLAPAFSKHILKNTPYSQIMVGGSNFGEMVGAIFVVFKNFHLIISLYFYSLSIPLLCKLLYHGFGWMH